MIPTDRIRREIESKRNRRYSLLDEAELGEETAVPLEDGVRIVLFTLIALADHELGTAKRCRCQIFQGRYS